MDKRDIRALQREHVEGALRAREAGLRPDHALLRRSATFPIYFLYPYYNRAPTSTAGSFENRFRFTRRAPRADCARRSTTARSASRFSIDTLDEPFGYGDRGIRATDEGVGFIAPSTTSSTTGTSTSAP